MNIGLFTDTYYPEINGVANSVFLLKKELEAKGHTVYVITTKTPDAPENEVNVFRVPSMSCSFVPERRIGLFYQPLLAKKIRQLDLDVIHTHTEFSLGIFGRIMAKELLLPVVHTYHTIYEDYTHYIKEYISNAERAKKIARSFSKISVKGAEEIVVPTQKVKELLVSYGVQGDITVIPTGINLEKFGTRDTMEQREHYRKDLGLKPEDKAILYIGRISKEKNIDEIMQYLDGYFDIHNDCKFVIVGDGQYRKSVLEPLKATLKHGDRMLFAGSKSWDDIAHYYQTGDVFVSASTSETQGLTYIEALASGLPVVARADECLDNVIEQGVNGFTYETETEFLEYLDNVLYKEQDNVANAENYIGPWTKVAMESVEKFSTKVFADKIENIYFHAERTHKSIIDKLADKVADRIGYEREEWKPIPSKMSMFLGNSQLDASRIVLGCMRMADLSVNEVEKVIHKSLDMGITLFDHADIYGGGRCEELFGQVLGENKGLRDKMRIQTKCGIKPNYYDLSKKHILESVDNSLSRLQTDYLDLLLLHRPDTFMDPDEIAEAFSILESSGKVRAFGVSNFNSMQIALLQEVLDEPLLVNQMQFGLGNCGMVASGITTNTVLPTAPDRDGYMLDFCRLREMTIQAWSPLQYGLFEGSIFDEEKFPKLNEVLQAFANRYQVTKAMIAIAWILKHPANMQVITGSMNVEHIADICRATEVTLTKQEWYELYQAAGNVLP